MDDEFLDPVRKIFRDRSYLIHKRKIDKAQKRVDNSSPFFGLPKIRDNGKGRDKEIRNKNLVIYKNLRRIYDRETSVPKIEMGVRSSPGIVRKLDLLRIANENEAMIAKLSQSKSSYGIKEFEAKFRETKMFAEKISKANRMITCKKMINNLTSRA